VKEIKSVTFGLGVFNVRLKKLFLKNNLCKLSFILLAKKEFHLLYRLIPNYQELLKGQLRCKLNMLLICIVMIGETQGFLSVRYRLRLIQEALIMMNIFQMKRKRNLQKMQLQDIIRLLNLNIIQKIQLLKVRKISKMLILNKIY